jgi:hypothetical protein
MVGPETPSTGFDRRFHASATHHDHGRGNLMQSLRLCWSRAGGYSNHKRTGTPGKGRLPFRLQNPLTAHEGFPLASSQALSSTHHRLRPVLAAQSRAESYRRPSDNLLTSKQVNAARWPCNWLDSRTVCMARSRPTESTLEITRCLALEPARGIRQLNAGGRMTRRCWVRIDGIRQKPRAISRSAKRTLIAAKRAWIAFRDSECALASFDLGQPARTAVKRILNARLLRVLIVERRQPA